MKIIYKEEALNDLRDIQKYIARVDSISKAKSFIDNIKKNIKTLTFMPYKYRKSFFYEDENVRDFIFNGYTIVYEIREESIAILTIFRQKNF